MYSQITIQDVLSSKLHEPYLYKDEIRQLQDKFGNFNCYYAVLKYGQDHWQYWQYIYQNKKDRRGEIAVNIQNKKNEVLLHTKPFYPDDSYRIPTGGIKFGERVLDCLEREVFEETGFKIVEMNFAGLLLYEYQYNKDLLPFSTYMFNIKPDKKKPVVQDLTENISGFKWVNKKELKRTIKHLQSLKEGRWPDWGRMRAVPHVILYDHYLKE